MRQAHWKRGVVAGVSAALVGGALYAVARTQSQGSLESVALAAEASGIEMKTVAEGFDGGLTDVQFVPGAGLRAVILEKEGRARVLTLPAANEKRVAAAKSGSLLVDVKVRSQSELGLLGLAFHPDFSKNGLFYLNYNPAEGDLRTRIAEWHVPPDRIATAPASERRVVLEVPQPYKNHNGGQLVFGPDRMLYIGLGDGGGGDDPERNGQNLGSLLGKMLRIDVNARQGNKGYAIPADNPFVGRQGARPEIWAY
ncbi:MAG TPA: PQQ-dependent sugar dehydrogenase, partial [Polyangiaceae bacterium]|nr:PQQ-dependent sugar dehydrogenase [Polyangiaceae bacterium]